MRMMLRFSFPTKEGNETLRTGRIQQLLQNVVQDLKPEAAYFYSDRGMRSGHFIFDMQEPSQLIDVMEPFFFGLGAEVDVTPVMKAEDIQKGMAHLPAIIERYTA